MTAYEMRSSDWSSTWALPIFRGKPLGALLHDVAHPEHGLDVLVQRRPPEQADLGDVGRAVARQAALALDGVQHRGLFAADVGAGAAAPLQREIGSAWCRERVCQSV